MFDDPDIDIGFFAGESDEEVYRLTLAEHATDQPEQRHVLPNSLETLEPGVFLAAVLASVDRAKLTGHDLVRYLQAQQRLVSHDQAGFYATITELAHAYQPDSTDRTDHPDPFASEEIQAALAKTRRSADTDLDMALDLSIRLPQVWEALRTGLIDLARARVFCRELETLHPGLLPDIVDQALPTARDLTTGQLRSRLKKACLQADPTTARNNYQAGLEDRKYVTSANPDHTATITIHNIRPEDALLASEHVHRLALTLKRRPGETRTIDQLRADITTDLLQGKPTNADTTTPPTIIIRIDEQLAHIPGYGPVLPDSIINLLQQAKAEPEPTNNTECGHHTNSRKPTTAQIRHIHNTYPTCIFPGCRMPAHKCDIDHRHQHSKGGKTTCNNLAPLCRHHHICKDQTNWKLTRLPNGSHQWTSPLGHTYTTPGHPP